jgi:glycosyltransferase involved in cell wall biosynthesis
MPKLAVLILTKNEEKNIEDCIRSAMFADEIVVIDSGSTDRTIGMAESAGARVVVHPMTEQGFAGQRNYALTQTDADWVCYLDADERITPEAAEDIRAAVEADAPSAYKIKRMNIVFGQLMRYGEHRPDYVVRLFPRACVKWSGVVHEGPVLGTGLMIRVIKGCLHHYTYTDWDRYFEKFNQYTTLMAKKMQENGRSVSFADILFHPVFAFFRFYILRLGFLDGKQGFIFAVNHYYYTMIKYVKLYYLQKKEQ